MRLVQETMAVLDKGAQLSDSILVSFSGGKDSLVVTDLCVRTFKRVEGFFMAFIPNLECTERMLEYGRQRWGIKIHQIPHWMAARQKKAGFFCFNSYADDSFPDWALRDCYDLVMAETGIPLIATGMKKVDSAGRRRYFANTQYNDVIYPLKGWSKFDVLAYMKARDIPMPPGTGQNTSGINLLVPTMIWLEKEYPNDFRKLCAIFPFAEAMVWRQRWYGIGWER